MSLVPIEGQEVPLNKGSRQKVTFKCHCGNTHSIAWRSYKSKSITSCGKCKLFGFKSSPQTKYGHLTLLTNKSEIKSLNNKALWKCDCEITKEIVIKSVLNGLTTSCGHIRKNKKNPQTDRIWIPIKKSEWLKLIPDLIDKNLPDEWTHKSGKPMWFHCKCGQAYLRRFLKYKPGISTCGKCHDVPIKYGDKIGNFIYRGSKIIIKSNSDLKDKFECCGCNTIYDLSIINAFKGKQKGCRNCNRRTETWWASQKFGSLVVSNPELASKFSIYSEEKIEWKCNCEQNIVIPIDNVMNGESRSCGNCRKIILQWYIKNENLLKNLVHPIDPEKFPIGGPKLLEKCTNIYKLSLFECWLCKRQYKTKAFYVIEGKSLTCGCINNKLSSGNIEIFNFLSSLGLNVKLEYSLQKMHYDVAVPDHKIVIEFQGLKWHSYDYSLERDTKKYNIAINNDWNFMAIYEDEWKFKKNIFKNLLRSKFKLFDVNHTDYNIKPVSQTEAGSFHCQYNYLGECYSDINYGAFYNHELVACISIISQQNSHEYEITRLTYNSNMCNYTILNNMIKAFSMKYDPKIITAFTDNRLFSEKVCGLVGFEFIDNVDPDYYLVKGLKRVNKLSLPDEGKSLGYKKIYDLGKKHRIWRNNANK